MLTTGIATAYGAGRDRLAATPGVTSKLVAPSHDRDAAASLFVTDAQTWLSDATLREEVFGPLGIIVLVTSQDEVLHIARALEGQLTCTLMMDADDTAQATALMPVLERKAGRILANGYPTGVEVCDAMVHGGPYPASTNFGATSVGTLAIRRFMRPVCYQNLPDQLRPAECRAEGK